MKKEFWLERWQNSQIGFHQNDINPHLLNYWPKVREGEVNRVFVPLCGKSKDLVWLSMQGYEVVAVEFSQLAVEEFFQEQNIDCVVSSIGKLKSYKSENITIYQGDFFDLSKEIIGPVSIVFDRASLIALPIELRVQYSAHLLELIDSADIFLISMEYDQNKMQGPPFSVPEVEVLKHYSIKYKIKQLQAVDLLATTTQFNERNLESIDEKVYTMLPLMLS